MSGRRLEPEIIDGIPPTLVDNSVLLVMSTVQQCTGVRGVGFHSVWMLCHLWCPTAGCTMVSHCWLHRSQFSLGPTPPSTLLRFRPAHSGAQWWDSGGKHLLWVESAKEAERTSCRHITAPHCLSLTCRCCPPPLTMIDRPVECEAPSFLLVGFSHIRGGEPVNLVMTEQVASHAG